MKQLLWGQIPFEGGAGRDIYYSDRLSKWLEEDWSIGLMNGL